MLTRVGSAWVAAIARKAGIEGVSVHAHAFRHTIVGKLMDAGNSLELVSKYMGHSSLDVTGTYYWVPTIQEVTEKLNNPFTGAYQERKKVQETANLELQLLYEKKKRAMQIIHHFVGIIGTLAQSGGSAADVQRQIVDSIPNLEEILKTINESVSSSISGATSIVHDPPAESEDSATDDASGEMESADEAV